jgi:hypothetical protein
MDGPRRIGHADRILRRGDLPFVTSVGFFHTAITHFAYSCARRGTRIVW